MSFKWLGSFNVSLCSMVELIWRNKVTHASERQHGGASGNDYLVTLSAAMWGILFDTGVTCHCNLAELIRNGTIRAYVVVVVVVVILNVASWLSGFPCYCPLGKRSRYTWKCNLEKCGCQVLRNVLQKNTFTWLHNYSCDWVQLTMLKKSCGGLWTNTEQTFK